MICKNNARTSSFFLEIKIEHFPPPTRLLTQRWYLRRHKGPYFAEKRAYICKHALQSAAHLPPIRFLHCITPRYRNWIHHTQRGCTNSYRASGPVRLAHGSQLMARPSRSDTHYYT